MPDKEQAKATNGATGSIKNLNWTDKWIAICTGALVLVAATQFFVTYRQPGEMHAQSNVLAGQLEVMRKDQPAWISVPAGDLHADTVNAAPYDTISIKNTGKTAAIKVAGDFYVEIVKNGNTPHFESQTQHVTLFAGVLAPNQTHKFTFARQRAAPQKAQDAPLTQMEKSDLDNGRAWIAGYGEIVYHDVFNVEHWVKFCTWHATKVGAYQAMSCAEYNAVDGN